MKLSSTAKVLIAKSDIVYYKLVPGIKLKKRQRLASNERNPNCCIHLIKIK